VLDENFCGFITMPCSVPGCTCFVRGLFGDRAPLSECWAMLRDAARDEGGWIVTPGAREEGPHFCACKHEEVRDGR
jgi:hypothetical protein